MTRRASAKTAPTADAQSGSATNGFGAALLEGLQEAVAVAYERGERPLRTRTWQQEAQGRTLARDEVSAPPARRDHISPPPQYDGARIRAIRTKLQMSQRHFASALNVSDHTVQAWERDARRPDGSARRLLEIAEEHPAVLTATIAPDT
jgi:DNA-binding transcriptional regulator YiaG